LFLIVLILKISKKLKNPKDQQKLEQIKKEIFKNANFDPEKIF
jgi:hypothetical protein